MNDTVKIRGAIYSIFQKASFIYLIGLVLLTSNTLAQTVYVAPSGNDNWEGTRTKPVATLPHALQIVRQLRQQQPAFKSPLTIVVMSGEYFIDEPIKLRSEDSGTEKSPLLIRGEGSNKPIIHGGYKLPPFREVSDSLWTVDAPATGKKPAFEQLYVNNQRATPAQSPNVGFYRVDSARQSALENNAGTTRKAIQRVHFSRNPQSGLTRLADKELDSAVVTLYHKWNTTTKRISTINRNNGLFTIESRVMPSWNRIDKNTTFRITNTLSALDAPGEWFLNAKGQLFYIPRKGETPENTTAWVPSVPHFLLVDGSKNKKISHVSISNIAFKLTSYTLPAEGIEPAQGASPAPAAIELNFADHFHFENIEISHTGAGAVWFKRGCTHSSIRNSIFRDMGANAVKLAEPTFRPDTVDQTHHITLHNNIFYSGGHVFPNATAVLSFHSYDNVISHNDISDFRYTGISIGWIWGYGSSISKRNIIEYNRIHHLGWGELSDMGGVYTLGPSEGTVIRNNVIHDIYGYDYGGWGIYTDEGSTGILIQNNLVYACKSAGFHQHYGKENIITNNIFALQHEDQLQLSRKENHNSFTFSHNIVLFDNEHLLQSLGGTKNSWLTANLEMDYNCYWNIKTKSDFKFHGLTFKEWQTKGRDKHSIIENPSFKDPVNRNFKFKSKKTIRKIGFEPFDNDKPGVYGIMKKITPLQTHQLKTLTSIFYKTAVVNNSGQK